MRLGIVNCFCFAGAILSLMPVGDVYSAQLSKTAYVNDWTNACVAGGKTQMLKLTAREVMTTKDARIVIASYRAAAASFGSKPRSFSELFHKQCGCIANFIADRKKDTNSATLDSLAVKAGKFCMTRIP